ncbi:elongator complex protein 5 [Amia ocellicauda]|uniref:elongator complex protein 5 n=1 Tax=Amia ocellicauda TaxID=2972642 RepID=UPI00346488E5
MLLELIQGTEGGGFVVITDSAECPARPLLKSFVNAALKRGEQVHVLGFDVSEEELRSGLEVEAAHRLLFHDGYTDPLGWRGRDGPSASHFSAQEIGTRVGQTRDAGPVTLVVDSLSWVLRHSPPAAVCQALQELRRGAAAKRIVLLLHSDLHPLGVVGSVCHLASAVVAVAAYCGPGGAGGEAGPQGVATSTRRSKSGKVLREEEGFSVGEGFLVQVQGRHPQPRWTEPEPEDTQADPAANLTFNLRLSEGERQAREKLPLPFAFSSERKSALLQPRSGGGRILYEPDAADDFDQEDPDDDLDV